MDNQKHILIGCGRKGELGLQASDITLGGATAITAAMGITITLSSEYVNLQPPSAHPKPAPWVSGSESSL